MIKCGVCGSENEAQALFCGTCGSPLTPAETKEIAEEAKASAAEASTPDDTVVVPGKGGATRNLGTGGETGTGASRTGGAGGVDTKPVTPEPAPDASGPTIVCSVCGTVNDASRTYCRKCANELKPAAPAPPPTPPPTPGPRISPVIIGLAAAGLVVAVGVGIILALGGIGPGASPTLTASQPGTAQPSTPPTESQGQPSEPPDTLPGRIVYAGGTGVGSEGVFDIFVVPADLSAEPEQISGPGGNDRDPGGKPDGSRLVYATADGILVFDFATGDTQSLTDFGRDISPSWSRTDDRIAFAGRRREGPENRFEADNEIRFKTPDEEDSIALTSNEAEDYDPVFTRDGESVIWVRGEGDGRDLLMIGIDDGDVTRLTRDSFGDSDPAVSPTEDVIVFASNRGGDGYDLYRLDLADPSNVTLLESSSDENPVEKHDPWFSPDGNFIVFSAGPLEGEDLYVMDLRNGNAITKLISSSDRELSPIWIP